jgi:hypothetical protein
VLLQHKHHPVQLGHLSTIVVVMVKGMVQRRHCPANQQQPLLSKMLQSQCTETIFCHDVMYLQIK